MGGRIIIEGDTLIEEFGFSSVPVSDKAFVNA